MDGFFTKAPAAPLSPLHEMLGKIRREKHASNLNRLINDPSVYPWVHGNTTGPMDMTGTMADPDVFLLMGQHGAILLHRKQIGAFEIHCQCYPEGRGAWMLLFARAALHWIFTRTECVEVLTRLPRGNLAARALAKRAGMRFQFHNPTGWNMDGKPIPADIFGITIQDWMVTAPGLDERGQWFHRALENEYLKHGKAEPPHPDDASHDRYVGVAFEMLLAGQPDKALIFYNRWAALADYATIKIISRQPLALDIRDAILVMRPDGNFYVATLFNQNAAALN